MSKPNFIPCRGKFEKHIPLLVTVLFFATGDYVSLIRHLRFLFYAITFWRIDVWCEIFLYVKHVEPVVAAGGLDELYWWTGRDLNPRPYGTNESFRIAGNYSMPSGRFSRIE